MGNIALQAGSTLAIELGGTVAGTSYDQLNATGSVSLAGLLAVSTGVFTPTNGDLFFVLANNGLDPITGRFSNALVDGATYTFGGSQQFKISYFGNSEASIPTFTGGNDVVLMAIPEPNATLIAGIGGLLLLLLRGRRKA